MYFNTIGEISKHLEVSKRKDNEVLMVLVSDKSAGQVSELRDMLNRKEITFFGAIYPALLVGDKTHREGFIVQHFEPLYCGLVLPFMMRFPLEKEDLAGTTSIVLVDGLTSRFKDLTDTLEAKVGSKTKYIGGGAGFYSLEQKPCIFDNKGIYQDGLYLCILKQDVVLAVEHGWKQMEGPFTITKSKDNVLMQLDGIPAFEVYRDIIIEHENIRISREDFFSFAKDYPFGIEKKGEQSYIVRDPISVDNNEDILCVANLPQGYNLYVLHGNKDTLLGSSQLIATYCSYKAPEKYRPLLFDCISRAMFLEDDFEKELRNIQEKLKYQVEGALSIGEIASAKSGEIVIHNKSTIIGLVAE
ncbi:FIST signal transduction protein [Heliorestis convoluta]|uniref:FIST domain-containing protein n=1 Tax=Heliorestis convoluta TaxID=356322 RepID=A0A5Q2MYK9_9FIRM|nr:FIST C-terminal domain-containing protein [Heliorestis convoluta]QGG46459.1 FIST domain-containing protein [Heliorestis convoluta]